MAASTRKNLPQTYRAPCADDVEADDYVYADSEGILRKAKSDSINTMPAIGYVTKISRGYAYFVREYVISAESPIIGPQFISKTEAGKTQTISPTGANAVQQQVAQGIGTQILISIDKDILIRS